MSESKVVAMQTINVKRDLLVAESIRDGYTWTLASRLGDMLHMAEELFGPRDCSYTILGVEFTNSNPQIWYPGNRCEIVIQLNLSARTDTSRACYQLSHETIHLLSPTGGNNATNFEEGVACYFPAFYMKKKFNEPSWRPDLPSYKRALKLIEPSLDTDFCRVHRLRDLQPSFSQISKEAISAEFPDLTSMDLEFLASRFNRNASH